MNLLEKAKIITTATAYDDGKLHSVKGGAVADFDVVRGSAATRVNAEGLIEEVATNIPRIDYSTGEGVILTEPQSTNLIPYSEDFSQWVWGGNSNANNTTRVDGYLSPDGEQNAALFTRNSGTSGWFNSTNLSVTLNQTYTYSLFVKKGTSETIELQNVSNAPQSKIIYNIDTNIFTTEQNATAISLDYGNGWYRIAMTFEHLNAPSTSAQIRHNLEDGESMYVFGAQFENLSYATSYIPTSGAIATRLADSITGAGDVNTFNDSEGVLYAEIAALADDTTDNRISLSYDFSNYVRIAISNSKITFAIFNNGAYQANGNYPVSNITDFNKIAVKYKENDFALWVNGTEVRADTSGLTSFAAPLDHINFSNANGNNQLFKGKTKCIAVFSEALTDEELTCLTTI